jgi:hypothetical protein
MEGVVKSRNVAKKYIVVEGESGDNVFVSTRNVAEGQRVHIGDRVSFDQDPDETKGKRGKNLRQSDYA